MNAEKNIKVAELKDRLREAMTLRNKKAVDLSSNLDIPKSAISQYLSGRSKDMDSPRLYKICVYLDVSEAWMMGFDVPMERPKAQKNNDTMADIIVRMRTDEDFFEVVKALHGLDEVKLAGVMQMLQAFNK